jgi:hypothetical protein
LGEFSPIGRSFSLSSFVKLKELAKNVRLHFWAEKVKILPEIELGNILRDFFTNSSGHPGQETGFRPFTFMSFQMVFVFPLFVRKIHQPVNTREKEGSFQFFAA